MNLQQDNVDLFGEPIVDRKSLKETYIVAPFSILDTSSIDWQTRKNRWRSLGIKSEDGRDGIWKMGKVAQIDRGAGLEETASIFDPVLCEVMYRWYVPEGGRILDPFAGGSVRGIVANYLGYRYTGVDLRQEQLDQNVLQAAEIVTGEQPGWICGDSADLVPRMRGMFDFLFSCPPYYSLEVYSDDPADISNMTRDEFDDVYERIIAASCERLKDDSFACFVVANCRDSQGYMQDLVGTTIRAFERNGVRFYNDIVLRNCVGSGSIRARLIMKYKKVVKMHQNVLVFCKGDPKKAAVVTNNDE